MKESPEISVVMSVFNSSKYLERAILSILNQTYKNFEFIIIDDGSVDNSLQIINRFSKLDSRIVVIKQENKGLAHSLNIGIEISRGKYIARMDADDISFPDRLALQYKHMESNLDIGVLGTGAYMIDEDDRRIKRFKLFNSKIFISTKDQKLKSELIYGSCFIHPSIILRKSILNNLKYVYDSNLRVSEDFDLWCRLSEYVKFENLAIILLEYRVHTKSMTMSNTIDYKTEVMTKILDNYLENSNDINKKLHVSIAVFDRNHIKKYKFSEVIRYMLCIQNYIVKEFKTLGTITIYYRYFTALKFSLLNYFSSINRIIVP